MWVFALILAVPLIEIGLFVTLGGLLGLWPTLGFVLASAVFGVWLLRGKAMAMGQPNRASLRQIAGSGFSVVAAVLLILPGFLTSFLGLILLLPIVQRGVIFLVGQRLASKGFIFTTDRRSQASAAEDVIDADFTVVGNPEDKTDVPSKWSRH